MVTIGQWCLRFNVYDMYMISSAIINHCSSFTIFKLSSTILNFHLSMVNDHQPLNGMINYYLSLIISNHVYSVSTVINYLTPTNQPLVNQPTIAFTYHSHPLMIRIYQNDLYESVNGNYRLIPINHDTQWSANTDFDWIYQQHSLNHYW